MKKGVISLVVLFVMFVLAACGGEKDAAFIRGDL